MLVHLAIAGVAVAIVARHIGPPSHPAATPPVPIVVVTPRVEKPSPLPSVRGNLPVPAKPTPTPVPSPTPTPVPSPTPKPSPTVRPTPKPTPKPKLSKEQQQFRIMRQIPYFKHMTDAQLRHQKLPPGMKNWSDVITMNKKLNGLNWVWIAPPTGQETPQPTATASTTAVPSALPSPLETVENGHHTLSFSAQGTEFVATWQEGDKQVQVSAGVPVASTTVSPAPSPAASFAVPYTAQRDQLMQAILGAYLQQLFGATGTASPQPSAPP